MPFGFAFGHGETGPPFAFETVFEPSDYGFQSATGTAALGRGVDFALQPARGRC
jgi:hypothetical protein